jgi:hypothetical protein
MDDIKQNFTDIRARIPKNVTLVAVSKVQPPEKLQAALDCGQRVFGENRVQEAQAHWAEARKKYPDLRLHLIGGLQTNKVDEAVELFDVIETVDRIKLADAIAKTGKKIECLIQVNTGEEAQKGGVLTLELEALYKHCKDIGLNITGLMCIPPAQASPIFHFGLLASWAKRLGLKTLSMGMSGDFEDAIRMGATHVRVGSALFGERVKQ